MTQMKPLQKQTYLDTTQKDKAKQTQSAIRPNPTGIPTIMKAQFESLSGLSFDDVRIHYNSSKPAQLQALAYTQGNHVYMAPRQEKHLGHELGHIIQQKQGRVISTSRINQLPLNDDERLEEEATRYSHMAMQLKRMPGQPSQTSCSGAASNIVQRTDISFNRINYLGVNSTTLGTAALRERDAQIVALLHINRIPDERFLNHAAILRASLVNDNLVIDPSRSYIDNQAHHIIETSNYWGQNLLQLLRIDPDSAINGVLLPTHATDDTGNASVHCGSHSPAYRTAINAALTRAIADVNHQIQNPAIADYRAAVVNKLASIRIVLLEHNVPLNRSSDPDYDPVTDAGETIGDIFTRTGLI